VYAGADIDVWAPSLREDPAAMEWLGRYRRAAMSPDGIATVIQMFLEIDVRHVLPTLHVPTLVLHRRGDRVVNWRAAKWMAEQIPGARYVEMPGQDHFPWAGNTDAIVEEVRAFLTGTRVEEEPDRVLATVMFTDVVGSTERAASLGDRRWTELLDAHDAGIRRELAAFRGQEIKTTGDGFLATFDGPARAIRCASGLPHEGSTSTCASVFTQARSSIVATTSVAWPSTSANGYSPRRVRLKPSSRARSRISSPDPASSSRIAASTS
jgi:hypothetical protein